MQGGQEVHVSGSEAGLNRTEQELWSTQDCLMQGLGHRTRRVMLLQSAPTAGPGAARQQLWQDWVLC